MLQQKIAVAVLAVFTTLAMAACQQGDRATATQFLANLAEYEGMHFQGVTDYDHTPEAPFGDERLVIRFISAQPDEVRIALDVGENRSRTWVLTLEEHGLLLKHDHRHPDGTPEDRTMYGGYAAPGGTAQRQSFPADLFTAESIPEASTNIWTMQIDRDRQEFMYDLTRHGRPRFRAVFDLSRDVR